MEQVIRRLTMVIEQLDKGQKERGTPAGTGKDLMISSTWGTWDCSDVLIEALAEIRGVSIEDIEAELG